MTWRDFRAEFGCMSEVLLIAAILFYLATMPWILAGVLYVAGRYFRWVNNTLDRLWP